MNLIKRYNLDNLNIFYFTFVLFSGILFFLGTPDLDQNILSFLDHRSIFTHSLLFPYIVYYFLIRKGNKTNVYINLLVVSFFVAVGIHLSADLHPKSWQGYANIKFLGKDLGTLSFFWILINAVFSYVFGVFLLREISAKNNYLIIFLIITIIIGAIYSSDETVNNSKIFFTIIFLLSISTYHVLKGNTKYLRKYTKNLKPFKNSFFTEPFKKLIFKLFKIIIILYILYIIVYTAFVFFGWLGM